MTADLEHIRVCDAMHHGILSCTGDEPLAVSADERLPRAAQLMAEHGVSHLVVLDAESGQPIGVLSTIDIATVYAGN
jgi:CBS domain-containing protein